MYICILYIYICNLFYTYHIHNISKSAQCQLHSSPFTFSTLPSWSRRRYSTSTTEKPRARKKGPREMVPALPYASAEVIISWLGASKEDLRYHDLFIHQKQWRDASKYKINSSIETDVLPGRKSGSISQVYATTTQKKRNKDLEVLKS